MHSPIQAANSVLSYSFKKQSPISPLKLQKLVYFIHGWFLAWFDQPTLDREPEAWQFGPVFPEVYHDYKIFGSIPISQDNFKSYGPLIKGEVPYPDANFHNMLEAVWKLYSPHSALTLSDLTHRPGTPWSLARERGDRFLNQEEIKQHFKQMMKK